MYTKLGMELMGFFCEGFDGVGTQKPVTNAAEVGADKGVLIRVPAMETFNQCNLMLGFRTTSIPYSDTYTGIQTGLADGASGVPANLFYLNFRDVIKYFYDYQQVQEATSILINKAAFDSLLPEDQEAIRTIIQNKCAESYKLAPGRRGLSISRCCAMRTSKWWNSPTRNVRPLLMPATSRKFGPSWRRPLLRRFLDGVLNSAKAN